MSKLLHPLFLRYALLLITCGSLMNAASAQDAQPLVLAPSGPLYSIANGLLDGTEIKVMSVSAEEQSQNGTYTQAGAVVSMDTISSEASLYAAAQAENPSVANIDVSRSFSSIDADAPPNFWVSPGMVVESIETTSEALAALYPSAGDAIRNNESELTSKIQAAREDFEKAVSGQDLKFYGLTNEFFYLTNDINVPVVGQVIKPEDEWVIDDFGELIKNLYDLGQPMVIASKEPIRDIGQSARTAGARLVVLDTYAASTEDIVTIATSNMEKIVTTLAGAARPGPGGGGEGGMGGGAMGGGGMGGMGG